MSNSGEHSALRRYSADTIARCDEATRVLHATCAASGRWAVGRELNESWLHVHGAVVPNDVVGRWTRAFAPALTDGTVHVNTEGRRKSYAPAMLVSGLQPTRDSELVRVELALAAACRRCGGAVPVEEVERELSNASAHPPAHATPTWSRLGRLVREHRIQMLVPGREADRRRRYYAPLGEPQRIARSSELDCDRRVRAIHALWRASGSRPFTTRAIATYTRSRDEFRIAHDPPYGWTNALQHFATTGLLCRVESAENARSVRWALAVDWRERSVDERDRLLHDPHGRVRTAASHASRSMHAASDAAAAVCTAAAYRSGVDVAEVSRNRNMVALLRHAVDARAAETSPSERSIRVQQPVTIRDIERLRGRFPRLLPVGISLVAALHEATRIRPGMRVAALAHLGTVRNTAYLAEHDTTAGRAFVAWHRVVSAEDHVRVSRVIGELEEDVAASHAHGARIPASILHARVRLLHAEVGACVTRLNAAEAIAPLVASQRARSASLRTVLHERMRRLESLRAYDPDPADAMPPLDGRGSDGTSLMLPHHSAVCARNALDIALAADQLRSVASYRMTSDRELWSRIVHGVRLVQCTESTPRADRTTTSDPSHGRRKRPGRAVVNAFERVSFAFWAARRFGSPLYGGLSEQARRSIGELRDTAAIVGALLDPRERGSHTELCAALGFIDDADARDGLVHYLTRACEDAGAARGTTGSTAHNASRTNSAAISTAVFGLALLPFGGVATHLRALEREILVRVRDSYPTVLSRAYASLVIEGWDAKWTPEEWMRV